jgi:hypothetical protein
MFKKLIFRIRVGLMHWEEAGNNREVFFVVYYDAVCFTGVYGSKFID